MIMESTGIPEDAIGPPRAAAFLSRPTPSPPCRGGKRMTRRAGYGMKSRRGSRAAREFRAMGVALRQPMTIAEFLAWEDRQPDKHEFDGFAVVAMTGVSRAHSTIQANLMAALR